MCLCSFACDSAYFGFKTWTVWNFLKFNFIQKGSDFYGKSDLLWFFYALIPQIIFSWLPFLLIGIFKNIRNSIKKRQIPELSFVLIITTLMMSVNAHKEERFLTTILPLMFILVAKGLNFALKKIKNKEIWKKILFFVIFSNLIFFIYFQKLENSGPIQIVDSLRDNEPNVESVLFFTQCHKTPYYSQIHKFI